MNTDGKSAKESESELSVENSSEVLEREENQNQSEPKLPSIPDLLQEVQDIQADKKIKKDESSKTIEKSNRNTDREQSSFRDTTNEPLSSANIISIPIVTSISTSLLLRPRSGGLAVGRHTANPISTYNQSRETVTTKTSLQDHVSTLSSIQNTDPETISTQSSNQTTDLEPISNDTSVENAEPGILSNQVSLSYDVSELEPVSLYSFHVAHNSRNHFEVEMKPTSTVDQPISMCSVGSVVCRICHNAEEPERLISPCLCKGTLAYVHKNCLEHWLRTSGMVSCELCHYRFKVRASLRYTFLQSLRMWYSHPNNRGLLQADFLVCSLLTVVSFGLVGISMMALQHFVLQGRRYGVSRFWTQICILMFLSVISFVYSINMFLILKSQLVPWYTWWQSAKDVTLILENRKSDLAITRLKEKQKNSEEIELESMIISREARPHLPSPTPPTPPLLPPPLITVPVNATASHSSRTNDFVATV